MESLSKRLLDRTYVPSPSSGISFQNTGKVIPCPVEFTDDPIEFCESPQFLNIKLRKLQKEFLLDLYSVDSKGYPRFDTGVFIAGMRGGKSALAAMIASFQLHRLLKMESPAEELHQLKGQRITIQFIASSEAQAKETAYAAFESIVSESFWFQKYIQWLKQREESSGLPKGTLFEMLSNKIEFHEKNVAVLSLHSNSAALVGKTSACCVFDELSRFDVGEGAVQSKTQKRTAQAVYDGVAKAATSLIPFSKVVTITSPLYEDDYGMRLLYMAGYFKGGSQSSVVDVLRKQYPMKVDRMMGYHATTFELNPKYDENGNEIPGGFSEEDTFFKSKRIESPEGYRRDFLAIPPSAISPFFEYPERIDKCMVAVPEPKVIFETSEFEESLENSDQISIRKYIGKRVYVTKPDRFTEFYVSCDQGERRDAFVVAMAHGEPTSYETHNAKGEKTTLERYKVVVDFVEGWIPDRDKRTTVSFPNVEEVLFLLHNQFNIKKIVFDQWNSTESIQRLFSKGILTEKTNPVDNLQKYEVLKLLIYSGLVELPPNDNLHRELRQLNLVKGKKVDHGDQGSSDFADAVARVVWEVYINVIEKSIQGDYIHPLKQRFSSLRSINSYYDWIAQDPYTTGVFSAPSPVGGSGIFGQGFEVRQNVFPNLHTK